MTSTGYDNHGIIKFVIGHPEDDYGLLKIHHRANVECKIEDGDKLV